MSTLLLILPASLTFAQGTGNEAADNIWETSKFSVVIGVLLTILLGIVVFLVTLEVQVKRLQKRINNDN